LFAAHIFQVFLKIFKELAARAIFWYCPHWRADPARNPGLPSPFSPAQRKFIEGSLARFSVLS